MNTLIKRNTGKAWKFEFGGRIPMYKTGTPGSGINGFLPYSQWKKTADGRGKTLEQYYAARKNYYNSEQHKKTVSDARNRALARDRKAEQDRIARLKARPTWQGKSAVEVGDLDLKNLDVTKDYYNQGAKTFGQAFAAAQAKKLAFFNWKGNDYRVESASDNGISYGNAKLRLNGQATKTETMYDPESFTFNETKAPNYRSAGNTNYQNTDKVGRDDGVIAHNNLLNTSKGQSTGRSGDGGWLNNKTSKDINKFLSTYWANIGNSKDADVLAKSADHLKTIGRPYNRLGTNYRYKISESQLKDLYNTWFDQKLLSQGIGHISRDNEARKRNYEVWRNNLIKRHNGFYDTGVFSNDIWLN